MHFSNPHIVQCVLEKSMYNVGSMAHAQYVHRGMCTDNLIAHKATFPLLLCMHDY